MVCHTAASRIRTELGSVLILLASTPRPHFIPGKDPAPILKEAGWAPGPVWTGGKSRPHRDSIPNRPARRQSLYRLSYWAQITKTWACKSVQRLFLVHDYFCCQNEDDTFNLRKEFWEWKPTHETGILPFWQKFHWSQGGDTLLC